jgi:hypothetical protein
VGSVVLGGRRKWVEGVPGQRINSRGRGEGALQISPQTDSFFFFATSKSRRVKENGTPRRPITALRDIPSDSSDGRRVRRGSDGVLRAGGSALVLRVKVGDR